MTGQAVFSFVILKPEFKYDKEEALIKELTLQVRKNIGPCEYCHNILTGLALRYLCSRCPETYHSPTRSTEDKIRQDHASSAQEDKRWRGRFARKSGPDVLLSPY